MSDSRIIELICDNIYRAGAGTDTAYFIQAPGTYGSPTKFSTDVPKGFYKKGDRIRVTAERLVEPQQAEGVAASDAVLAASDVQTLSAEERRAYVRAVSQRVIEEDRTALSILAAHDRGEAEAKDGHRRRVPTKGVAEGQGDPPVAAPPPAGGARSMTPDIAESQRAAEES